MTGAEAPGEARAYHRATRHSPASVRRDARGLDWDAKPFLFKVYPTVPPLALARDVEAPAMPALEALARVSVAAGGGPLDLDALRTLLFFAAGLTRTRVYPGGETIQFRAAASTGALYEVEVYVVAGTVTGLEPGVYHFGPGDFALRRLRAGDFRRPLAEAAGRPDLVLAAPMTIVLTALHWRNTWKYRARAYRHFFWDAGTMLANLLATAVARDLSARVLLGFADPAVNGLLGLDAAREGALALVPIGQGAAPPPPSPPVGPLDLPTVPLSPREVDEPLVRQAYAASSLGDGRSARAWARGTAARDPAAAAAGAPGGTAGHGRSLGETILHRGSTRRFGREPIAAAELATILAAAGRPLPLDAAEPALALADIYLLVHAVDGLVPGAYACDPGPGRLEPLEAGDLRAAGGHLCLDQALGADASAVAFFLADLAPILARLGSRGYRAANLAAGLLGGRMYLAAYALGLGASGLTFYDDLVVQRFAPHAAGKDALFVTAVGRAARRRR